MLQNIGTFLRNLKIRTWLLLSFLTISLIPLFILSYIFYTSSKKAMVNEILKNLNSIALRQSSAIENYIRDRELTVTILSKDPTIIEAIQNFSSMFSKDKVDSTQFRDLENKLFPFFSQYQQTSGFQNIYLVSATGDVVYALTMH